MTQLTADDPILRGSKSTKGNAIGAWGEGGRYRAKPLSAPKKRVVERISALLETNRVGGAG